MSITAMRHTILYMFMTERKCYWCMLALYLIISSSSSSIYLGRLFLQFMLGIPEN